MCRGVLSPVVVVTLDEDNWWETSQRSRGRNQSCLGGRLIVDPLVTLLLFVPSTPEADEQPLCCSPDRQEAHSASTSYISHSHQ